MHKKQQSYFVKLNSDYYEEFHYRLGELNCIDSANYFVYIKQQQQPQLKFAFEITVVLKINFGAN